MSVDWVIVMMTLTVAGKPLCQAGGANDGATTLYTSGTAGAAAAATAGDEVTDVAEIEREVWAKMLRPGQQNTRSRTCGQGRRIKNTMSNSRVLNTRSITPGLRTRGLG